MASMATSPATSKFYFQRNQCVGSRLTMGRFVCWFFPVGGIAGGIAVHDAEECFRRRLPFPLGRDLRSLSQPMSAIGSGLEASITDSEKNDISLGDVKIVIESRDDDKIHVRVDLTGEGTQKAFDDVLMNLARTAPPIPGFRKMKGGKTSNVPKSFLLQILGRDRVTKFLIQEIVSTSIGDYVKKENLPVKKKCNTAQTAEELESAFIPGKEFGFNATLEIEKSEVETDTPTSS